VTLIYVSHRLDEIFRLCDTITVLRDGRHVITQPAATLNEGTLVEAMIGRSLGEYFPKHLQAATGRDLMRVEGLSSPPSFQDVSFTIRAGEVVGLAGLVGAGRSEVARALFGLDADATGHVWIDEVPGIPRSPAQALRAGVALVPEDRKRQGLILSMSAVANTTLPTLSALSRLTFVSQRAERTFARAFLDRLRVRVSALDAIAAGLSGGTQQKVVLAKWLAAKCRVLILDEPTRGIDVGAKAEIHALVDDLAAAGHAVLLISSELAEILHLSTRIIVLRAGRVAGELPRAQATQADLLRLMAGTN
jgi:ABC-type sugar transport system ATPase subunit